MVIGLCHGCTQIEETTQEYSTWPQPCGSMLELTRNRQQLTFCASLSLKPIPLLTLTLSIRIPRKIINVVGPSIFSSASGTPKRRQTSMSRLRFKTTRV